MWRDSDTHDGFCYDAWSTAVNWAVDYAWWKAVPNEINAWILLQQGNGYIWKCVQTKWKCGNVMSSRRKKGLIACNGMAVLALTLQ